MNLEQLEYVVEIAKTQSFSAAAEQLHVTQSAISQSVHRLEKELGLVLFERSRQGTHPTPEGKQFVAKALDILQRMDELKSLNAATSTLTGDLHVATFPSVMPYLVQSAADMKRDHPQLRLSIEEKGSMEIIEDIRTNKTHLGFIAIYAKQLRELDGLHFTSMYSSKLVVCAHHLSELAKYTRVTPDQLKEHKLALYRDGFIEDFLQDFIYEYGSLSILFKTNNSEAISTVLNNNIAATIGHDFSFHQHPLWKEGLMKMIEITEIQQPKMQIGFVQTESREAAAAAEQFARHFRQAIELGHL
ncbi:LysR family transcriptional regulator [Paenibacillus barcinonensis]|uniref:DNA-binding transcriptional LysR family regulator n=1 Tax=Paenibacillus barcinonensis TaxID=198119 RepID=A0A2V4WI90_PAEBA|nr:LysR family transcriptional regulator [Paenibacillus barcinonensis]PYE47254.1 DNA-binding transcriptional LysR family regulator [Paenibacillus barcinonensis]QKS58589.1 LysR family transcriptional regulator [Paenibacillus barcinonensis]